MKSPLRVLSLIFSVLLALSCFPVTAQSDTLTSEQYKAVNRVIDAFRSKNKARIATLVRYPLTRQYPLGDIRSHSSMLDRFNEVFDPAFLVKVASSKPADWSEVGWRGIMLQNGSLWIDEDGRITAVNHQSTKEVQLLEAAIQADKSTLPPSLRNFKMPVYLIVTKHHRIRIDELEDGTYRYASWKLGSKKPEADLLIENGTLASAGSGGYVIKFANAGFTYTISINIVGAASTPDATLSVLRGDREILTEGGRIVRR